MALEIETIGVNVKIISAFRARYVTGSTKIGNLDFISILIGIDLKFLFLMNWKSLLTSN
jgi:hypothetical protein